MNAVLPYESEMKAFKQDTPESRQKAEQEMQKSLKAGNDVVVSLKWGKNPDGSIGGHQVIVEKIEGDYVYIRNPWGSGDRGGPEDTAKNLPAREVQEGYDKNQSGGHIKISKEEFYKRLKVYHIPKEQPQQQVESE